MFQSSKARNTAFEPCAWREKGKWRAVWERVNESEEVGDGRTLKVLVSKAVVVMQSETLSLCAHICVFRLCVCMYACMPRSHGAALI